MSDPEIIEMLGLLGAAAVYVGRALRDEFLRWRQRTHGGPADERTVRLLESIDRNVADHHVEMTRYQASIAAVLGEIKGRLGG